MNWYHRLKTSSWLKSASVTFFLDEAYRIAQPKDMLSLCTEMSNFFRKNGLTTQTFNPDPYMGITPDGNDFDQMTGTINLYVPQKDWSTFDKNEYEKAIQAYIDEKSIEGFQMQSHLDKSNMTGGPVYRIRVAVNGSEKYPQIPEVNMANGNAAAILRLLGLSNEPSGSIDLLDLKNRINAVSQESMQQETIEPGHINPNSGFDLLSGEFNPDPADAWKNEPLTTPDNPNSTGPAIMHGGRDMEYIDYRLQGLYEIVDYGLKNGFKRLAWG